MELIYTCGEMFCPKYTDHLQGVSVMGLFLDMIVHEYCGRKIQEVTLVHPIASSFSSSSYRLLLSRKNVCEWRRMVRSGRSMLQLQMRGGRCNRIQYPVLYTLR